MLEIFLTVLGLHLLVVMTPGPNFLIIVKEAVTSERKNTLMTVFGVILGAALYVIFGFLGFIVIISQSALIFNIFKVIGAVYLIYLGIRAILSSKDDVDFDTDQTQSQKTFFKSFRLGILTNMSNPKAALYFMTLFTTLVPPDLSLGDKSTLAFFILLISTVWYVIVAYTFSNQYVQSLYRSVKRYIDIAFGGLFVYLGFKIATAQQ